MSSLLSCRMRFLNRRLGPTTLLTMLFLLLIAIPIQAAQFRGDENVTIGKEEVIDDDLVMAGNVIVVDGVINGDLVAAGAQIVINGHVKGSLIFAGQLLVLNGAVDGAVYSGAGSLTLGPEATVGRNLFFGGYSYRSEPGSMVGRDNLVGGYQAIVNGTVNRNLYASLAALELNGKIGGDVTAVVDQPGSPVPPTVFTGFGGPAMPPSIQPGLRVGPEAQIAGKFSYTSPVKQTETIAATPAGGVVYNVPVANSGTATVPTPSSKIVEWFLTQLRHFVSLLLLGALALWLRPLLFEEIGERMMARPLLAAGWGFLATIIGYSGAIFVTFLLIFIVTAFAVLTLAGLATSIFALGFSALGLVFTLFSMLVAYGSKLVVFYPLARRLLDNNLPAWNRHWIVPLSLGTLAFVLLASIPWLGTLFSIAVTFIGLGAIWMMIRSDFAKPRAATPRFALTPA
jgi:hypothetical protein